MRNPYETRSLYAFDVTVYNVVSILVDGEYVDQAKNRRVLRIEAFDGKSLMDCVNSVLHPETAYGETTKVSAEVVEDVALVGVVDYEVTKVYRPISDHDIEVSITKGLPKFWFRV